MAASIVGREAELASLRDFVGSVEGGAAALVLEGEAGMGKTTLWHAGVEDARERGLLVLEARPAESESALSFSAIGDLLDPVLEDALAQLPEGQRRALSRSLVLADDEGPPPDSHAVGVALLNTFRALARERSVLVAVDDAQWLDPASAGGLAYAGRRLRNERVGLLLSRRAEHDSMLLDELRRALPASRVVDVDVGPLDADALHHVVRAQLGAVLPRPLLAEVREASGGNPFYALEIVRMLRRSGLSIEAGQRLPVPKSLRDLVDGRLRALSAETRDFLLAAAAHAQPTVSITEAASGVGRETGLVPALDARIVELDRDRIRFTHPILAAGAYEAADPVRRAEVHARLAALLEDPEARAWQLAACSDDADETVASTLERAAHHARGRGAPRPAALLLDRARELTPADRPDDALRRAVEAAFLHFESGDAQRAEAQLRDLIAPMAPGVQRARALRVLARVLTYDVPDEAAELFLQVVDEADGDRELLAAAHEGVASALYYALERLAECGRHAEAGLVLARELRDETLEGDVLISKLGAEALLGDAHAGATAERALALQETNPRQRLLDQPLLAVAEYWLWTDEPARAKQAFVDLLRRAEELGDESSRPYILFFLGQAEHLLGDLEAALERAREGQEAASQSGQPLFSAYNHALQSLAHAQLGNVEQARAAAAEALALPAGRTWYVRLVASSALGHLELMVNAPERVLERLAPLLDFVRREAISEPSAMRFVVDEIEALVELGRLEEAGRLLAWYESTARSRKRSSALAACARCRGLLAASAGQLEEALAAYAEALDWHEQVELPLSRARTLLALGVAQRRAKRRREARGTLEEALAVFERIGAAVWAERARAELRRISGRAASAGELTPAEARVAELVAEGKTNREVAAALFLSERTVEGHLSHVYGKLGVRSRTQLARELARHT